MCFSFQIFSNVFFLIRLCFHFQKACLILFATIAASFCAEPINVEVNNQQQSIKDAQPQKRGILSDCDEPAHVGLHGGFNSDLALSGDLALGGLHGHGFAPSYSGGYASGYSGGYASGYSGGYLGSSGLLASGGILASGAVGHIGHAGTLGAVLAAPPLISHGYAPQAPILASSVVSAPVFSQPPILAAPAVCTIFTIFNQCFRKAFSSIIFEIFQKNIDYRCTYTDHNQSSSSACSRSCRSTGASAIPSSKVSFIHGKSARLNKYPKKDKLNSKRKIILYFSRPVPVPYPVDRPVIVPK